VKKISAELQILKTQHAEANHDLASTQQPREGPSLDDLMHPSVHISAGKLAVQNDALTLAEARIERARNDFEAD